jgi:hypothetical protein
MLSHNGRQNTFANFGPAGNLKDNNVPNTPLSQFFQYRD